VLEGIEWRVGKREVDVMGWQEELVQECVREVALKLQMRRKEPMVEGRNDH
jgi:hypothetical protein